jgi:aspartyl-tRNA(Asn)/glutamyl-tRNA(Gln) amidotransferase subunit A
MTAQDLCYLPATEAIRLFKARGLSPVELLDSLIERAEAVEPVVNALSDTYYDQALEAARAAEASYMGKGEPPKALSGVPVAIKEETAIEGLPLRLGSLAHKDDIAGHTAVVAERILAAGGIMHARTTTPEFSCAPFTHTRLWGVTRNPWNPEYGAGGSSGGAGASLASGTTTLASGSDIGGSIRIPASFNGVVGFKPPFGRVPEEAPFNLDQYCHEGPLARTVADCALLQNVISGPDARDLVCVAPKLEISERLAGIEGMRVAFAAAPGDFVLDEEVARNTTAAAEAFREAGAVVEEVELPVRRADVWVALAVHFAAIFAAIIKSEDDAHPGLLTPYARAVAEDCMSAARDCSFADGLFLESEITAAIGAVFERHDVLVLPAACTRGFIAGDDYTESTVTVGGVELTHYAEAVLTLTLFNIASRCPVMAVPSGFADNGVPTGLQIAGRPYDDVTVFRAAAAYERVRPWLDSPGARPMQAQVPPPSHAVPAGIVRGAPDETGFSSVESADEYGH